MTNRRRIAAALIAAVMILSVCPAGMAGPASYTVRYLANGGTGAPASQTKIAGTALTLSTERPIWEGWRFTGWNTAPDGSGTAYAPGGSYTADEDLTLYAMWTRITYTVTYDANGGTGAPASQVKNAGEAINLTTAVPVRNGYAFRSWNMQADGSGTAYQPGAVYEEDASVTLYAMWQARTYTVRYDANGGFGAPADQQKTHGTALTLSPQKPNREGFDFVEWNTAADGSGTAYQPGGSFTADADTVLYAVWAQKTYTVEYDANGGSGAPASQTKRHGEPLALSTVQPARTGYSFRGWNTQADGSGTAYQPGDSYTANADVKLYAVWQVLSWPVRYDANGGVNAPAAQTREWGTALTLSSEIPTRSGWAFVEWNTAADGSGASYAPGDTYSGDAALTLYAIWTRLLYTVTYDPNGGSGGPALQIKEAGVPLRLSDELPAYSGHTFVEWNTSASGTGMTYRPGDVYAQDANLDLYAIWRRLSYTVYYNGNGGTGAPASQTKEWGIALTLSSQTPVRSGYTFVEWNTAPDGSGTAYAPGDPYSAEASVTLYAVWQQALYTVTYSANGGSGAPASQTRAPGETLVLSTLLPTWAGHTFVEWNDDPSGAGEAYAPGAVYTRDASVTLYAIWRTRTYSVVYDANGGENAPAAQEKTHGTALTLTSDVPSRSGWSFSAWNTRADGSGTAYAPGASYTQDADVTLYAVWAERMWTLTYDANGGTGAPAALSLRSGETGQISLNQPTRAGYTFREWNTAADGSGTAYRPGDPVALTGNLTLYAVWRQVNVTVIFETFGLAVPPDPVTLAQGGTLVIPTEPLVRPGYRLSAWNTAYDGSGASYAPGASLTVTANMTLFAVWEQTLFVIRYDANGGVNPPADQQKTRGTPLTLTDALPLRAGHTFQSWNTAADGSGTAYAPGAAYTAEADATLYAQWAPDTYTVSYDANGGTGAPAPQTKTHGVTLTLSTAKPTRSGCVFAGWSTQPDGQGAMFLPGAAFDIDAETTLFAVWDPVTYTVHYDANGGTGAPADQQKLHGTALTLSSGTPWRDGWQFVSWNTASNGAGTSFMPGDLYTLDASTTLYAQWNENPPSPPIALTVLESALSFSISPDGRSIYMNRPTVVTHVGTVTYAYNCYDDGGSPVNYYYSGAAATAMTPGRNGRFCVFCVVSDEESSVTIATGWVQLSGYGTGPLTVAESSAVCALSPDHHSLYIDRPTISGGTGTYTVAYNCYDSLGNPVNYYYSNASRTAMTPGYPGLFCVFVVVSDGHTSLTINTGWHTIE